MQKEKWMTHWKVCKELESYDNDMVSSVKNDFSLCISLGIIYLVTK